jgi:hypothetical protein
MRVMNISAAEIIGSLPLFEWQGLVASRGY